MRKGKHYRASEKKLSFRKPFLLAAVSLLLVCLTAVSATVSWIEDVSKVEFNSNEDSQQTPVRIGNKILKSDAVMMKEPTGTTVVNLEHYFNKSGDMHLSPCYSDGENFYFPVEKKDGNGTVTYRTGTKDDANVNYLSATFRVQSQGAATSYWFEKSGNDHDTPYVTFKDGGAEGSAVSSLEQYLRCSITIDGSTNVYALNTSGQFITVANNSESTKTGRRFDQYTYYQESFNNNAPEEYYKNNDANVTNKPNQGAGNNLNGNTLFTVNQYDSSNKNTVKTVTVKLWLEYNNSGISAADLASVNINIVSSWAKDRRIYVYDNTIDQVGYDNAHWLPTYGGRLFFGLKSNLDTHWELSRVTGTNYYYVDIPAVYNKADVVFVRCGEYGWNDGHGTNNSYTSGGKTVQYWNKWETTFPNTFHSETYTVYSDSFATWENASQVHAIYIVNSTGFGNMYDYMWDSNSVITGQTENGQTAKVVRNAAWPGIKMTTKLKTQASGENNKKWDVYAFFYNSDYDRIIFNDGDYHTGFNQEYQTQDLWLTNNQINHTFDMSTLTWFNTVPGDSNWSSRIPTFTDNETYIWGTFSTNSQWKATRLAYGGEFGTDNTNAFGGTNNNSSGRKLLCKVYVKSAGQYRVKLCFQKEWYCANNSGNYSVDLSGNDTKNYEVVKDNDHTHDLELNNVPVGVLRIYVENGSGTGKMKLYFAHGEN